MLIKSLAVSVNLQSLQENLGSNEMLLYVAVDPEDAADLEAGQPPVASLRKKHSIGKSSPQVTLPAAPRIAYSYQVTIASQFVNNLPITFFWWSTKAPNYKSVKLTRRSKRYLT